MWGGRQGPQRLTLASCPHNSAPDQPFPQLSFSSAWLLPQQLEFSTKHPDRPRWGQSSLTLQVLVFYLCLMVVARLADKEMTGSPQDRCIFCALSLIGFSAGCVDSHQGVWYMWGLLGVGICWSWQGGEARPHARLSWTPVHLHPQLAQPRLLAPSVDHLTIFLPISLKKIHHFQGKHFISRENGKLVALTTKRKQSGNVSHSIMSTLCDPMDCSPPGSFVHGIFQARMLEWVFMPSSRGSSRPRDRIHVSYTAGRFFII